MCLFVAHLNQLFWGYALKKKCGKKWNQLAARQSEMTHPTLNSYSRCRRIWIYMYSRLIGGGEGRTWCLEKNGMWCNHGTVLQSVIVCCRVTRAEFLSELFWQKTITNRSLLQTVLNIWNNIDLRENAELRYVAKNMKNIPWIYRQMFLPNKRCHYFIFIK